MSRVVFGLSAAILVAAGTGQAVACDGMGGFGKSMAFGKHAGFMPQMAFNPMAYQQMQMAYFQQAVAQQMAMNQMMKLQGWSKPTGVAKGMNAGFGKGPTINPALYYGGGFKPGAYNGAGKPLYGAGK